MEGDLKSPISSLHLIQHEHVSPSRLISRREFTDCERHTFVRYSGCRERAVPPRRRKRIGQNGPGSPKNEGAKAKGNACTDPLHPPASKRVEPSRNFQDSRPGAGSKIESQQVLAAEPPGSFEHSAESAGVVTTAPALLNFRDGRLEMGDFRSPSTSDYRGIFSQAFSKPANRFRADHEVAVYLKSPISSLPSRSNDTGSPLSRG